MATQNVYGNEPARTVMSRRGPVELVPVTDERLALVLSQTEASICGDVDGPTLFAIGSDCDADRLVELAKREGIDPAEVLRFLRGLNTTGSAKPGQRNIYPVVPPVGGNAYAIGVSGDLLSPDVADGQIAIFDPDAGPGQAGEVVAVWLNNNQGPFVVRLELAVPPFCVSGAGEMLPVLVVHTDSGKKEIGMDRVRRVDRMVGLGADAEMEVAHG